MGIPKAEHQRVAIRCGTRHPTDAKTAIRARHVLYDGRLRESVLKPFAHHAPEQICRPAWRKRHNNCDLPRRIIERRCDARRGRQCESARHQMQKFATGKFHGERLSRDTKAIPTPCPQEGALISGFGPERRFWTVRSMAANGGRIQPIDATPFPSNLARWNGMHMR